MPQCLCDSLLLHAEGCGTTGRSRVNGDGGITQVCLLERLATEHPPWEWGSSGTPASGGLGVARVILGAIRSRMFSEQIRMVSIAGSWCGVAFLPLFSQYVYTAGVST